MALIGSNKRDTRNALMSPASAPKAMNNTLLIMSRGFSPKLGKSPLDADCVVGPGGLELHAKHAVVSNESPIYADLAWDSRKGASRRQRPVRRFAIKCCWIVLRPWSETTGNRSRLER
jgi:hypothetical protein